jgi:hypothetical protein
VSVPDSHHSRNVAERPDVRIVVFDSSLVPGETEAVYVTASARMVPRAELADVVDEAFRTDGGAVRFTPDDLSGDAALRLFVARATSFEVHVRGPDTRPTAGATTRGRRQTRGTAAEAGPRSPVRAKRPPRPTDGGRLHCGPSRGGS